MTHRISALARRALIAASLMVGLTSTAVADQLEDRQAQIRTAMVFNFARFAEWENRATDAPITLCVSRDAKIGQNLVSLDGRMIDNRVLKTHWLDDTNAGDCTMAYLSDSDVDRGLSSTLLEEGVLTVSSAPSFSDQGIIGLVRIGRQTRFEVNKSAASSVGITLSSKLLRIAAEVK